MARKLKRRDAGEAVAALSDRLSDVLLGDEALAKERMEAVFVEGMGVAADLLTRAPAAPGLNGKAGVALEVTDRLAEAVAATRAPFARLAEGAIGRGLDSMREELALCERTIAARYRGIGARAVDQARAGAPLLVNLAVEQYSANAGRAEAWFQEQLLLEINVSFQYAEATVDLMRRLISPEPVRLPRHSGRGLWWKGLEFCHRATREIEIAAVNTARQEAMVLFNRFGEEIDNGVAVQAG